jgi:hypothetical protein
VLLLTGAYHVAVQTIEIQRPGLSVAGIRGRAEPMLQPLKTLAAANRVAIANANRKISERAAWLSDSHSEGYAFRALRFNSQAWYIFTPYYPCPAAFIKDPRCECLCHAYALSSHTLNLIPMAPQFCKPSRRRQVDLRSSGAQRRIRCWLSGSAVCCILYWQQQRVFLRGSCSFGGPRVLHSHVRSNVATPTGGLPSIRNSHLSRGLWSRVGSCVECFRWPL